MPAEPFEIAGRCCPYRPSRGYPALERVVEVDRGGHFPALENPGRFVAEIRVAFRPHR